jgi:hypothetical protein
MPEINRQYMLAPTFKDAALEKELNDNGYVYLPGFLPREEIAALMATYHANHKERERPFWNSHNDLPLASGVSISDQIRALMQPRLDAIFNDWFFPFAQFIVLNPKQNHHFAVHRDDSIFDEEQIQYRQLWMPLVDLTTENGTLYMVPKSHKLFTDKKPSFVKWPYEYLIPALEPEFVTYYAKAGDLLIWIDKTLHGSYENNSNESRPAFQGGVIHRDVKPVFHRYVRERDEVEIYQVDTDFFLHKEFLDPASFSKYPLLRTEKYSYKKITDADVKAFYAAQHSSLLTP